MVYLFHTITAQDWRRMLRAMAVLVLVWMVLGATSSYAQSCATRTVNTKVAPPPNTFFKTGSVAVASKLADMVSTVTFTNCSGFSNTTLTFSIALPVQFKSDNFNVDSAKSTSLLLTTSQAINCFFNSCLDVSGTVLPSSSPDKTDGIMFNAAMEVTGLNASGRPCLSNPQRGQSSIALLAARVLRGTVVSNSCTSFTVDFKATIDQNNIFLPATVATIVPNGFFGLKGFYGIATEPGSLISGNPSTTVINSVTLFAAPTFRVLTGTCSLTLPNSGINFQPISLNQLNAATNGAVVASQDFTLAINNCQGTSIGTKKALTWTFTTPKASDLTRMENAVANGATGMSAQIQADSKISAVDGSALPSVITSGETYIASGNTSNVQTLTYKANLIRNADTVTTGSFSSTAMVTLSYQ
jgi:type 1 fimbria pilin